MAILVIIVWITVFSAMIRAVIMKDILWPQKQEDREEGGWKKPAEEKDVCDLRGCSTHPDEETVAS